MIIEDFSIDIFLNHLHLIETPELDTDNCLRGVFGYL